MQKCVNSDAYAQANGNAETCVESSCGAAKPLVEKDPGDHIPARSGCDCPSVKWMKLTSGEDGLSGGAEHGFLLLIGHSDASTPSAGTQTEAAPAAAHFLPALKI